MTVERMTITDMETIVVVPRMVETGGLLGIAIVIERTTANLTLEAKIVGLWRRRKRGNLPGWVTTSLNLAIPSLVVVGRVMIWTNCKFGNAISRKRNVLQLGWRMSLLWCNPLPLMTVLTISRGSSFESRRNRKSASAPLGNLQSPTDLARLSAPPVPPGLPLVPPALTEKNENTSALTALLSPLKSAALSNDISSSPTTHFSANMDSLTQTSILTSGQSPSSSLAPPNSRYPDLSPNRQGIAFQSPLTVAGLTQAEPPRPHEQNRARSDAGPSAAPPALALDIRAASASHVPISQPTPQSTNGRSTPTMSGFSSQIDSVRGTSAASSSQSSAIYNGNGDGSSSPGSGSAQPSYAQGKGSRFAKFWDNKPKDQVQVASPQQAQPPSQVSGSTSSSSQGWPSNAQLPSDLRGGRSLAQPRQISAGSDHGSLNGLFPNLNIGAPFERHDRATSGLNGSVPDSDRMQNLLSMLSPQQVQRLIIRLAPSTF
ncbi:hypothetical protein BS47DRAFT_1145555 [Hydnum rufescens UP504]|uniref:Uncharacterized protein n=1 Tax=Hydnum rufescens UP504 TaxID=1448309 RepID=A0A9P6AUI8_9AGAM|nr:hypothetical protein BS47DRAFT_1145555 [Hydnum rufescens UP504]